jgi:hypothetical protein
LFLFFVFFFELLGRRDQEDHGSKPAGETVCETLSQKKKKKSSQKRAGGVTQGVAVPQNQTKTSKESTKPTSEDKLKNSPEAKG